MTETDVFDGYGIRVKLNKNFNVVRETIGRIGCSSEKIGEDGKKTLWQSCHLFHKRGEYAILHFKELFEFDGKEATITDSDIGRRNRITRLLEEWGLVEVIDREECFGEDSYVSPMSSVVVVKTTDKDKWNFKVKYSIGKK